MSSLRGQISLSLLCLLLGVLLVSQFRTQAKITADLRAQQPEDQLTLLGSLIESNARLREEIARLDAQHQDLNTASEPAGASMREEIERLRLVNGLTEARGSGVRVTLDANLEIYWLQDLLNELRNAGALGISVNGQRVLANSVIGGNARQVLLDAQPLARPYLIEAVGAQETLTTALNRPGGLVLQLRAQYGPAAAVLARQAEVVLAPHPSGTDFQLAQPAS